MKLTRVAFLIWLLPMLCFAEANLAVESSNRFAFDLYKTFSRKDGSVAFSPFSVSAALSMASAGARGQTLVQLNNLLHASQGPHKAFRSVLSRMRSSSDYELVIANRLWTNKPGRYFPDFLKQVKHDYLSDLTSLDFKFQPEPSRAAINSWVKKKTKGKIMDLLPEGSITPLTDLVIANAMYFKGTWFHKFKTYGTRSDQFFTTPSQSQQTAFMNQIADFAYAENADAQMLVMPYKGSQLNFVALLPKDGITISQFENRLSYQSYLELNQNKKLINVYVTLPKFKSESDFDLGAELKQMGMDLPFNKAKADFSGIRRVTPGDNLYVSNVFHKAFFDVTEDGTEAAAATAVMTSVPMSGYRSASPPKMFKANHPFLYMIVHQPTGAILFLGRYSKP